MSTPLQIHADTGRQVTLASGLGRAACPSSLPLPVASCLQAAAPPFCSHCNEFLPHLRSADLLENLPAQSQGPSAAWCAGRGLPRRGCLQTRRGHYRDAHLHHDEEVEDQDEGSQECSGNFVTGQKSPVELVPADPVGGDDQDNGGGQSEKNRPAGNKTPVRGRGTGRRGVGCLCCAGVGPLPGAHLWHFTKKREKQPVKCLLSTATRKGKAAVPPGLPLKTLRS